MYNQLRIIVIKTKEQRWSPTTAEHNYKKYKEKIFNFTVNKNYINKYKEKFVIL